MAMAIAKIEHAWDVDVAELRKGLPIIRYLPGAPPVGKHGDEDRHGTVPNATLVVYLTGSDSPKAGQTLFDDANLAVTPEFLAYYAMPYVPEISKHPSFKDLFTQDWARALKARLSEFLATTPQFAATPRLFPKCWRRVMSSAWRSAVRATTASHRSAGVLGGAVKRPAF